MVLSVSDGMDSFFLHIGYVNYKTWEMAALVLEQMTLSEFSKPAAGVQLRAGGVLKIVTSHVVVLVELLPLVMC